MEGIDLRPLSLGELLDRTFRLYRNHFTLFVGIMAIPAALLLPINVASYSYQGSRVNAAAAARGAAPSLPAFGVVIGAVLGAMVFLLVFGTIYSIAVAAASCAVADVYLGRSATIRGSFARIRGRFWKLVGVAFNILLRLIGLMLLPIAVIGGSFAGIGYMVTRNTSNPIFVLFAVFGFFLAFTGGVVLYVVIGLRYAVSIPIAMLEDLGVLDTIRRSVFLTRGRRGQIFLTLLVAGVIASVGAYIFQMPFSIAMMISVVQGHWSPWLSFAAAASGAIGSALTGPISMIAIVLLYYDSRIRKEAFDLQFMMASLDRTAPAAGTASPA